MNELLNNYTPQQILQVIHQITNDYKINLAAIQDLYARIAKYKDPTQILAGISKSDLALVPALKQLILNPDDKYWHANLLTSVASEIYRIQDIWEWLDGEFGEIHNNSPKYINDKLLGLYHNEILLVIQKKLIQLTGKNQNGR